MFMLLSAKLFHGRASFGPMDAQALGRYGLLERMGVFGIEADTRRGAARFLEVSRRVLEGQNNILWITAEGSFTDARQRPVRLRPGLGHLARHVPHATILPLAIEYAFWNESRPEALVRFGTQIEYKAGTSGLADKTAFFEAALGHCMDELAIESMARDPALFHLLVKGRVGIGGVYDGWRRLRARLAGRRFDAAHEARE